jgi:ketosteroid isomerase-like protein
VAVRRGRGSSTVARDTRGQQKGKVGDRVTTRFCGLYKLRDGKICEFRVFPFLGEHLE